MKGILAEYIINLMNKGWESPAETIAVTADSTDT